jgi:hypothetical protein
MAKNLKLANLDYLKFFIFDQFFKSFDAIHLNTWVCVNQCWRFLGPVITEFHVRL